MIRYTRSLNILFFLIPTTTVLSEFHQEIPNANTIGHEIFQFIELLNLLEHEVFMSLLPAIMILVFIEEAEKSVVKSYYFGSNMRNILKTKFFAIRGRNLMEKTLWFAVHTLASMTFVYMLYDTTIHYINSPTAAHVSSDSNSLADVNFPAVAICNLNLISKKEAKKYTNELWNKPAVQALNLTRSRLLELIRYFGHLYTFSIDEKNSGDIELLQKVIDIAYNSKSFDISRIMEKITMKCGQNVVRCQWEGIIRNCQDIMQAMYTPEGLCCIFNHGRWTAHFTRYSKYQSKGKYSLKPIKKVNIIGADYGLWALLQVHHDDYFYQLLPTVGFKAMIYTPTDYPYRASGSNRDGLVMPGTETFISLGGSMSDTTEDFRSLKLERRNCDVQYEYYEYSYSECITSCKIQDIAEKCGCIPFYYPVPANLDHLARCNMTDLRCLNHYRSRWHTLVPQIQDGGHPVQAFMDFPEGLLQCDCYPSCTSTDYTIFKTFVSKNGYPYIIWESPEDIMNSTHEYSILNVNFGRTPIMKLTQDVPTSWFELMSDYGGICRIFLGFSIMRGIDKCYQFLRDIFKKEKSAKMDSRKIALVGELKLFYKG